VVLGWFWVGFGACLSLKFASLSTATKVRQRVGVFVRAIFLDLFACGGELFGFLYGVCSAGSNVGCL